MNEISIDHNGITYTAEFEVNGDALTVYLPNGESRTTVLRGMEPESTAMPHLRSYAKGVVATATSEDSDGSI